MPQALADTRGLATKLRPALIVVLIACAAVLAYLFSTLLHRAASIAVLFGLGGIGWIFFSPKYRSPSSKEMRRADLAKAEDADSRLRRSRTKQQPFDT